ncbi:cytochrome c3 family protein [Mangrovibacterium lignilyticum]|uniref:cytochrome c3 family protein n=1 Tax=Mangrovibacterium lignilyticum TaxID=2668052 RepID=UPI0013CF6ABD|nr:cytochrome c3 family protein [Mangrovibacterium lignilyticum]
MKIVQVLLFVLLGGLSSVHGQSDEDCFICHDDPELDAEKAGRKVSRYIRPDALKNSVHEQIECASCHFDAAVEDYPHPENLSPVDCGMCHDEAMVEFNKGIHGIAFKRNDKNSPTCKDCHGTHQILRSADPRSKTYKMNIPLLCGRCHQEGAPVANNYNISEHNIIENYSQGIHGKGLFKSGLMVTATCNNCHGNHLILPHTNLNSTTSPRNIAKTCMQCHVRIEDVHLKIINKELWEKKPGAIPACTDCHPPHKVELKNILETISDKTCLNCHEQEDVHKTVGDSMVSLMVDVNELASSSHNNITCVKCHSDVTANLKRPCESAGKVDCSNCHAEEADIYFSSGHGQAYFAKDENAPYCTDCHGTHLVKYKADESSLVFRSSIPELCGNCHRKDGRAANGGIALKESNALADYSTSVHGKSLQEKGLLSVAVCIDCHTAHAELKESDPRSSVYPANLAATCGRCHKGIYDEYRESDHAYHETKDKMEFPTCETCHTAHHISEVHQDKFMAEITAQCGKCHEQLAETYLETYHGKVYQLGYLQAARCSDCHGAHNILRMDNPNSMIGPRNIVQTCRKCHVDANMKFTGYLTHATHYNRSKFPWLYYTFWVMTSLLLSVFAFFGLHTLLWLPRSVGVMLKNRKHAKIEGKQVYVRRFTQSQRITHICVIITFILLALTGMMLKFAYMEWAKFLARLIGGAFVAGIIHRFAAIATFGYFIYHLVSLIQTKKEKGQSFRSFIFNPDSLMFNKQDVKDFWASIKWFTGIGPKPSYGRWTYWEKFDYFAVFWGVVVIGSTGLMLWFPEFFTQIFPGWLINVAQIIHSDEALLAVGFIFTIHFFNTHLRPESFPMDTVIFTGHVSLKEFKAVRPREFEELKSSGKLEEYMVEKEFSAHKMKWIRIFGFTALFTGIVLVILITFSMFFH